MLDAAYAFGICKNAELAGLHGQRAISLAAAERPLAAFHDNLTSVKVMLLCLSVWLSICLPACLYVRLSVCHIQIQTQPIKMVTQTLPVSTSAFQPLVKLFKSAASKLCALLPAA